MWKLLSSPAELRVRFCFYFHFLYSNFHQDLKKWTSAQLKWTLLNEVLKEVLQGARKTLLPIKIQ